MPQSSVFGDIPGIPVGTTFASREEVRLAGLHRHEQAGISGLYDDGADAIIVSGGYADDVDEGDRLVYTGQGGQEGRRQVKDQTLTRGNLALARSEEQGLPVRVIRGSGAKPHGPATGYRYDGLFTVTRHWSEPSLDGPLIWRYVLERADGGTAWLPPAPAGTSAPPAGTSSPGRASSVVQRVVRNSAITQWVKEAHDYTCQFCGIVLGTDSGRYAEGAHIRALGKPHNGPDSTDNVLCLCPNDHVLFDKGALYVLDAGVYRQSDHTLVSALRTVAAHRIDAQHVQYHREHFAGVK